MVNYGRSRACLSCKKRRVKCDQTRPACQRCIKIEKSCPGYVDDWDLAIRHENAAVASKVHGVSPALGDEPTSDLKSWIIEIFYRDYVLEPCGEFTGWLNFLPAMYEQVHDDSVLRLTMCAAAYANFAQKTKRREVEILAISAYNRALRRTSHLIENCSKILFPRETTMTSIFLLGLYENITSKVIESPRLYHSVALGAMAKLRGELLREGNGPGLLEIVCCQMQRLNLDLNLGPSPADSRLLGFLDPALSRTQALINCCCVSKFVASLKDNHVHASLTSSWIDDTFSKVHALDIQFETWEKYVSDALTWELRKQYSPELPLIMQNTSRDVYPAFITSFSNKSRAARVILHEQFLKAIELREGEASIPQSYQVSSRTTIQNLVNEILASLPLTINFGSSLLNPPAIRSVGGYINIWPLQVIMRSQYASSMQQIEARSALEKLGLDCGLNYAVAYARQYGMKVESGSEG